MAEKIIVSFLSVGRCHLHPIIGSPCSSLHAVNSGIWRLDQKQLTFNFKVQLPYDEASMLRTIIKIFVREVCVLERGVCIRERCV